MVQMFSEGLYDTHVPRRSLWYTCSLKVSMVHMFSEGLYGTHVL